MFTRIKNSIVSVWRSFALNARDILSTLLIITAVVFAADVISEVGEKVGLDISDTKDFVFALGKFAAVALCGVGYLTHVTFRQSLGEHDANEFMDTWRNVLTAKERIEWFFRVAIAGLIAAALVFSIGV